MKIIRVHSEWDLGIPEFYDDPNIARIYVQQGLDASNIEESLQELEDDGLIQFEWVTVVLNA